MRHTTILALTLLAGLLVAGTALASPAPAAPAAAQALPAPAQALPAWLADAPAAPAAPAVGIPQPKLLSIACVQPPTTFCESAACQCNEPSSSCPCGGVLLNCNETTHRLSCVCAQCGGVPAP